MVSEAQDHMTARRWSLCRGILEHLFAVNYRRDVTAMYLGDVCFADGDMPASTRWHRIALDLNDGLSQALEHLIFVEDAQHGTTDAQTMRLRQEWWTRFGASAYAARTPYLNDRDPDRPLRVGYVSGDFRWHSAAFAFAAIITGHTAQIEPYYYSTLEPDKHDDLTRQWKARHATAFRDVSDLSALELLRTIREDRIDILVDLAGYTGNNRLLTFAGRPAPIQIQAWGYVLGTGSPAMDVVFADPIAASPQIREHLTERVVDLPSLLSYFPRPDLPEANALPCLEGPPVFAVFNRAAKVNPDSLAVWRRLLERVPEAAIRFQGFDYTPWVQSQIREALGPTSARIAFHVGETDRTHKLGYLGVDLALDPWPQTGGISTLDALWMGVPTVTLLGERMIQRTSASLLSLLNLFDFISTNVDQYVEMAAAWVTTRRWELAEIRVGLRAAVRQSPIIVGYGDAVEAAYRSLWREWCATGEIRKAA